jgi:uncharacterized membrane protein YdbT with pleckstrin-like domain
MQKEEKDVLWYDRERILWFPFTFTKYWIKNGRLYIQRGFLNTSYDELLLYRVIDVSLKRSLSQKFFGTGSIMITAKADNDKNIELKNISNSEKVKDLISELVEEERSKKRIHGKEFFDISTDGIDDIEG